MFRLVTVLLLAAALLTSTGAARADDPPYIGWTATAARPDDASSTPSSANDCAAGRTHCVDAVIREMQRRFDPLAESCDHDSIFALAYLRTTEEYRRTIEDPTFFDDTPFVNHEDAVFARLYFDAYDAWHGRRSHDVPAGVGDRVPSRRRPRVTAQGNLSLGINAHVQRDLPFASPRIGLVKPDGSSRKPDHDRVNEFLNRVTDDLYAEIARRFDPTIDDTNLPGTADDAGVFQLIPTWREIAWRNAERLVAPRPPSSAPRSPTASRPTPPRRRRRSVRPRPTLRFRTAQAATRTARSTTAEKARGNQGCTVIFGHSVRRRARGST